MKDNDLISRQSLLNSLKRFVPEHFNGLVNDLIMKEPSVSFSCDHENDHIAEVSKKATQPEPPDVPDTNVGDTISRQAAIEAVGFYSLHSGEKLLFADKPLKELPPAQPEIIRCTECKHYREYDSKYVENAVVVQCMADRYPISETIPDGWFCAGAERKDDE